MSDSEESEKKYMDMSAEMDEIRYGVGAKEKTVAGLKIFGKSLFNITKFAVTEALPKMNEQAQRQMERNKNK